MLCLVQRTSGDLDESPVVLKTGPTGTFRNVGTNAISGRLPFAFRSLSSGSTPT